MDSRGATEILIFAGPANPNAGALIGQIVLDHVGQDRAFAQALLFGPAGKLFVPITNTGEVRRHDVSNLSKISFDIFVPSSSNGVLGGQDGI